MNKNVTVASGPGIGIGMILFIVFLVLKLTGHIAWSWWLVCLPLYAPVVLGVILLTLVFLFAAILVGKQ